MTQMLASPDKFGDVTVIWAGRNNFGNTVTVETDIASMVNALAAPKRFLILSIENASREGLGTGAYSAITQLNADLAATYPNNFLDIRELVVTQGLAFEGISPTPQDLTDMANDVPPTSLRFDIIHLNHFGYDFVAHQVNTWLRAHYAN